MCAEAIASSISISLYGALGDVLFSRSCVCLTINLSHWWEGHHHRLLVCLPTSVELRNTGLPRKSYEFASRVKDVVATMRLNLPFGGRRFNHLSCCSRKRSKGPKKMGQRDMSSSDIFPYVELRKRTSTLHLPGGHLSPRRI